MTNITFMRDRFTWLAYLMLAYYGYVQATLGPAMPFLRDELKMSYTVGALHFSAFALGMIIAGSTGDRVAEKLRRYGTFWGGGAGMAAGAVFFILSQRAELTVVSAFMMGVIGTYTLVMIQSTLSDRHGAGRAIALTEANVVASIGMGLAPFLVGRLESTGIGWRYALIVGVIYWMLLFFTFRSESLPEQIQEDEAVSDTKRKPLPLVFWAYWTVVFLGVAVEWSITSWGADFLAKSVGLSKATAATLMSVYFVAFIIGRFTASRLTRTVPAKRLLTLALILTTLGFFPFWLAPVTVLNLIGLFIAGLGISNLFPLTLSAAINVVSPRQSDAASGRAALAGGTAILLTPQALGTLADEVGISAAYGIVVLLLLAAVGVAYWANQLAERVSQ